MCKESFEYISRVAKFYISAFMKTHSEWNINSFKLLKVMLYVLEFSREEEPIGGGLCGDIDIYSPCIYKHAFMNINTYGDLV